MQRPKINQPRIVDQYVHAPPLGDDSLYGLIDFRFHRHVDRHHKCFPTDGAHLTRHFF